MPETHCTPLSEQCEISNTPPRAGRPAARGGVHKESRSSLAVGTLMSPLAKRCVFVVGTNVQAHVGCAPTMTTLNNSKGTQPVFWFIVRLHPHHDVNCALVVREDVDTSRYVLRVRIRVLSPTHWSSSGRRIPISLRSLASWMAVVTASQMQPRRRKSRKAIRVLNIAILSLELWADPRPSVWGGGLPEHQPLPVPSQRHTVVGAR